MKASNKKVKNYLEEDEISLKLIDQNENFTTYLAQKYQEQYEYLVKVFEISPSQEEETTLFLLNNSSVKDLIELPINIEYSQVIYRQYANISLIILQYTPKKIQTRYLLPSKQYKKYILQKLSPEEALYQSILILENYLALLRRFRKLITINLDDIMHVQGNLSIDYLSAQLKEKIFSNKKINPIRSLALTLYQLLYHKLPNLEQDSCLHFSNDIYNLYGLNNTIAQLYNFEVKGDFELNYEFLKQISLQKQQFVQLKQIDRQVPKNRAKILKCIISRDAQAQQDINIKDKVQEILELCVYFDNKILFQSILKEISKFDQIPKIDFVLISLQSIYQNQFQNFKNITQISYFRNEIENCLITYSQEIFNVTCLIGNQELIMYLVKEFGFMPLSTQNLILYFLIHTYNGQLDTLNYFIQDLKVNSMIAISSSHQWTPLLISAYMGYLPIVKYLIEEALIDPNQQSDRNHSLIIAAKQGHLNIVKYLIEEQNINPYTFNNSGLTALHVSTEKGHLDIVKYLIEKANVNINEIQFMLLNPLIIAIEENQFEIFKYLIEQGRADPKMTDRQKSPLIIACEKGYFQFVEYLVVKAKIPPKALLNGVLSPIQICTKRGDLDLVKFLLHNSEVSQFSKTLKQNFILECIAIESLIVSAESNQFHILKYLIEEIKVNPNISINYDKTILSKAAQKGNLQMVKCLIEQYNMDPQICYYNGYPPLLQSAANGHFKVIEYLIFNCDVDPNYEDEWGETALLLSAKSGHLQTVKLLMGLSSVRKGLTFEKSQKCLISSIKGRHFEVVEYLIQCQNVDMNFETIGNKSALYFVNDIKMARLLVQSERNRGIHKKFDSNRPDLYRYINLRGHKFVDFLESL